MTKRNFIFRVCGVMASPLGWYGGKARAQETTGVGIPTNVAPSVESYVENRKLGWYGGKAINNQCPVCGTMATRPQQRVQLRLPGVGARFVEVEGRLADAALMRCDHCNNAFWTSTEE